MKNANEHKGKGGIMKDFWGLLIIITFYIVLGSISDIRAFKELIVIIGYLILFAFVLSSMNLVNKTESRKMLIIWILLSIMPVALYSWDSYNNSGGGLISLGWDWLLWEITVPFFVGIAQIITIISSLILIKIKSKRTDN